MRGLKARSNRHSSFITSKVNQNVKFVSFVVCIHRFVLCNSTNSDNKSWIGCGNHISSVMDVTPKDKWCTCEPADDSSDPNYPPKAGTGFARKTTD